MRIRFLLLSSLVLVSVAAVALVVRQRPDTYTAHYELVLGTSMDVTLRASSARAATSAETAILDQIAHDSHILSSYDPASEFSQWFRTEGVPTRVSPELITVLTLFDRWRESTHGALDASAENISRVWAAAAKAQRLPTPDVLATAVAGVRARHWIIDAAAGTLTHTSTVPLALNSFTKSFIVDRAVRAALAVPGVQAAVVNVGGDLVARGDWTGQVGIADPRHNADNDAPMTELTIRNRAVATSGGYRRGFDIGDRHYSHIVDPRTGQPTAHVLSATVVADVAVDAGALATAFCVLTPAESERLAAQVPDTEFLLVLADGSRIESAGWRALAAPRRDPLRLPSPIVGLDAAGQGWNQNFQLTVSVDLAQTFGRRPYLAIWIEDKGFPIRTLALWFDKTRYLPELRGWYRSDRLRSMTEGTQIVDTVSSATRSPGRYTFTWDGKDGHGKLVAPGTYTVNIEAAREHGTYQVMRQDMDFSGTPKRVDLPANTEVAAASLDYHKMAAP
jgi:thiamine biosynthesis lipoprotein ApbE